MNRRTGPAIGNHVGDARAPPPTLGHAMRYLVTGALGAIGAWTLRALIDAGHEPVSFDLGASERRLRLALTPDELVAVPRIEGDVTGVSFVRASESAANESAGGDASVHHLDGPVVSVDDVIDAIEQGAPEAAGLISAVEQPLPFPPAPDAGSFIELVGGRVSRPLQDGVAETMARFRA